MAGESIRFNASLNTAGFDSGAARLQQIAAATSGKVSASFASMGAKIASVIAPFVGLYAAINSVKSALDMGGRLNDLSKTTGETAGNLAILERAFQNAGVGGERMGMAIASMSNFITDFQNGSKSASETMDRLGISMADLAGKSPIEQMQVFMSAIAGIRDPALRTALAMDVFKKAGKEIVPLASNFSGELANAKGELGSLPRILDENAASLDDLGDKLQNAVGSKLTELAVGLAAGATGADNFASSLAKIDAAGLGERIGDALRAAFAAPLEVLQGVGDFLISGILKAGNALVGAFRYAIEVFYNLFTDSGFWSGIADRIMGSLGKLGEGFALLVVNGLQSALGALKDVPFLGEFADKAAAALEGVKTSIIEAGQTASMAMDEGGQMIMDAWDKAAASSSFVYDDILGAEKYSKSASDHWEAAKAAAAAVSAETAKAEDNLATGSKVLTDAFNSIRGFDLSDKPQPKPDFTQGTPAPDTPTISEKPEGTERTAQPVATTNERIGALRGDILARRAQARAEDLAANGQYISAIRLEDRAQNIRDRAMTGARMKDILTRDFGTRDIGRAFEDYKKATGISGRMSRQEFEKSIREQAKTPEMRAREEQKAAEQAQLQQSSGGGGKENFGHKIDKIIKIMEKRLPIRVLAAA